MDRGQWQRAAEETSKWNKRSGRILLTHSRGARRGWRRVTDYGFSDQNRGGCKDGRKVEEGEKEEEE